MLEIVKIGRILTIGIRYNLFLWLICFILSKNVVIDLFFFNLKKKMFVWKIRVNLTRNPIDQFKMTRFYPQLDWPDPNHMFVTSNTSASAVVVDDVGVFMNF